MCLASSYLSQFQEITENMNKHFAQLSQQNSKLDREVSVLYHEIEKMDLTPDTAYHVCSLLQATLKKRRIVKDEFQRLSSLRGLMDSVGTQIKKAEKRHSSLVERSEQVHRSLNVTLTLEEIGGISL